MAGRGFLEEAQNVDTSKIYILRNGRWENMFRPINPDRSFSGVSLAESFAEAYVKKYNEDVGLICCADGGTSIDQWKPGELLFDNAVSQAKLAMRTSKIAGILWHQGETDASQEDYLTYKHKLENMILALRKELDLYDVPFIMGELGEFLEFFPIKYFKEISTQQREIAETTNMAGFVSAKGLSSNPDNLHFSADALYEFGLRYFAEYEKLRTADWGNSVKAYTNDTERSEMERL